MSDLISKSALLKEAQELSSGWDEYNDGKEAVINCINYAQTIDAVPVVRCGNCTHYTESPLVGMGCHMMFGHRAEVIPKKPDDFCSYGERRDNG